MGLVRLLHSLRTLPASDDSLPAWQVDVLPAPKSLWSRLVERIGGGAGTEPARPAPPRWSEPKWREVAPGISCQRLSTDAASKRVTLLVRLAPGVEYPPHRHAGVEELHLLDGELVVDDKTLSAGDYLRSEPGTEDHRVWSATGCTCFLETSTEDAILTGGKTDPEGRA